ncbi:L-threonylcarbamoyladenylate synthase [Wenzhouxiangella marina]|uniref:L-threonylcarbamoyladenylate synthase n=1 Tax=Wenzhouxiangella marina TaxID=1579979 RepID=A0A0K0XSQ8_9GAMM|nr:L-threonylcarbamoyladenylate synthase [Wenzhouxiangella marina]AKS40708.1 Translation factor, SUA5 type [Wenzhouxiangella marina]MBB6088480.1 L-threonylcarbamoyladenylate synthase [Wenzhouxiangella marina]
MDPTVIERMIEQGRDSYEARLAAGQARLKQGEAERAREHLQVATRLAPDKTMAWQVLGEALKALDELPAAARAWMRGIEVARGNGDQQAEKVMTVWLKRIDKARLSIDPNEVFATGRLIGLPTETVYGLAAPIDRPELVQRVFELKGRPPGHPLIVHVGSLTQARACVADWPEAAEMLAGRYWPGPLTLVLPKSDRVSDAITAGQATVALRMPDHPLALALLRASSAPLVAPSANPFTRLSPTRAEDVRAVFAEDQVTVVDGGPCRVGIESTIVALDPGAKTARLLRPGMISSEDLAAVLPPDWSWVESSVAGPRAPGQMREHYRPSRPLRVEVLADPAAIEHRRLALEARPELVEVRLPEAAEAAARELYQRLREADREGAEALVLLLSEACLRDPAWAGIVNRLAKAASQWSGPAA